MNTISVQDILRDLPNFLRRLESGEPFLVVRDERPLAEVRPVAGVATQPRPFGLCRGQFTVAPDFDRPLPDEIVKEFEGA